MTFFHDLGAGRTTVEVEFSIPGGPSEPITLMLSAPQDLAQGVATAARKLPPALVSRAQNTLVKAYRASLSQTESDGAWIDMAKVGYQLQKLFPRFSLFQFGASKLTDLVRMVPETFDVKLDSAIYPPVVYIRLKQTGEPAAQNGAGGDSTNPQALEPVSGTIMSLFGRYGFIRPDVGGENLFFHASDVANQEIEDLTVGQRVAYVPGTNEKGPCARGIHSLDNGGGART
jgi:cold shock CspA family protein